MNLEYVTCSGISSNNYIEDIIDLSKKYPFAEFAVQASPKNFYKGTQKYEWFSTLLSSCKVNDVHVAMHVNLEYRTELCLGNVPNDLQHLWNMKHKNGTPVIGRVQININGGDDKFEFHADKVADIIRAYPGIKFILQYAPTQHERVMQLDKTDVPFSLLQDYSGGCGESPDSWLNPVLPNHKMGYAGGLSPDNVADNLEQISKILPANYLTWIDAEGNLKSPDFNGKKVFDTALAEKYIERAYLWQIKNNLQK